MTDDDGGSITVEVIAVFDDGAETRVVVDLVVAVADDLADVAVVRLSVPGSAAAADLTPLIEEMLRSRIDGILGAVIPQSDLDAAIQRAASEIVSSEGEPVGPVGVGRRFPAVEHVLCPGPETEPLMRRLLGDLEDLGYTLKPPRADSKRQDYINIYLPVQKGRVLSMHARSGRVEFQDRSWELVGHLSDRFSHLAAGNKAAHPLEQKSDVDAIVGAAATLLDGREDGPSATQQRKYSKFSGDPRRDEALAVFRAYRRVVGSQLDDVTLGEYWGVTVCPSAKALLRVNVGISEVLVVLSAGSALVYLQGNPPANPPLAATEIRDGLTTNGPNYSLVVTPEAFEAFCSDPTTEAGMRARVDAAWRTLPMANYHNPLVDSLIG